MFEKLKRGERIIKRQKECCECKFLSSKKFGLKTYGFCLLKNMHLSDMNIWEDCKKFERIR